jgi:hypothetical protein
MPGRTIGDTWERWESADIDEEAKCCLKNIDYVSEVVVWDKCIIRSPTGKKE